MPDKLTIQRISPAYVVRALVPRPYGTYLVRYATPNDDVISAIQLTPSSITPLSPDTYYVLSVRVDETLYKTQVMNYRLAVSDSDDRERMLRQYKSQEKSREKRTKLAKELLLPADKQSWLLDSTDFHGLEFSRGNFSGSNNTGLAKGIWQRPRQDHIKIFVKRLDKNNKYFANELHILKEVCFFSITTLYGHYSDWKHDYLVFADGGNPLSSICPVVGRTARSRMRRIANIGFQIANAMMYLERKRIVHRDLTASNVLVDAHGFIRIADFGHAIQKVDGQNSLIPASTADDKWCFQRRFLAPECATKHTASTPTSMSDQEYVSFSSKSDVWAFGLVMIQLMIPHDSSPYAELKEDEDVLRYVVVDRQVHLRPTGCDFDLYCILQQCWAYEPIRRISFAELREKMRDLVQIFSS